MLSLSLSLQIMWNISINLREKKKIAQPHVTKKYKAKLDVCIKIYTKAQKVGFKKQHNFMSKDF